MKRRLLNLNTRRNHRAWLYSAVYTGRVAVFTVLILFSSFLIQPFHEAIAAEDIESDPPEEEMAAEPVREQVEEVIQDESVVEGGTESDKDLDDVPSEDQTDSDVLDSEVEDIVSTDDAEIIPASDDESQADDAELPSEAEEMIDPVSGTSTQDELDVDTSEVTATTTSATTTESSTDQSSSSGSGGSNSGSDTDAGASDNDIRNDQTDGDATNPSSDLETSDEDVEVDVTDNEQSIDVIADTPVVEAELLINDDNFYQFSKQSCVAVGDGTYHCSENDVEGYDTQSVVYAELSDSGYTNIFLKTSDDTVRQITDNEFDDTAPYYDAETLQIVWQRLIDGRHQVVLYDIAEAKESQLTFSRTNNMQPKVSEDGVVWQAWDNNDWEIMYFDGQFTDQITDNAVQDVAPVIQDSYVLWTVIGRGEQEAKVYSLDSQEIVTISGYDGGVIENPRFVLVYDTKFDNGDIITQGFDPATGLSQPIAAQPAPDPVDIPMPDPIGEIRALIQNKSTFEDELEDTIVNTGDNAGTSTATSSDTLNLKDPADETTVSTTTDATADVFELTEFDLILSDVTIDFDKLAELEEIDELLESDTKIEETSSTQE